MPKLRDLYDEEVISNLTQPYTPEDAVDENGEEVTDPFSTYPTYKIPEVTKGIPFSQVFGWKGKTIPDILIRVFKPTDWAEPARVMIPPKDPDWVWNRPLAEQLALAFNSGDTTMLHGLQGTGKSCAVQEYAATICAPFWRMSCNRETRETHFTGNPNLEYDTEGRMHIKQEPTLLTDSLRYGGIFCEDEFDRHNSSLVLQALREKTNRTLILPNADGRSIEDRILKAPEGRWWYALTGNTPGTGDETGLFDAEVQDASSLDRIDTTIEVNYLGKPEERKLLQSKCNLNDQMINGIIDVAKLIRNAFSKGTIMQTMSVRGTVAWANKAEQVSHLGTGLTYTFLNKLNDDDRKAVEDMFHRVFARTIKDE